MPALGEAFLISAMIASSLFNKLSLKAPFGKFNSLSLEMISANGNSAFLLSSLALVFSTMSLSIVISY